MKNRREKPGAPLIRLAGPQVQAVSVISVRSGPAFGSDIFPGGFMAEASPAEVRPAAGSFIFSLLPGLFSI